ncbi:MAG: hypothetical protein WD335_01010 [Candidatus Paceibacterota bacterium]
MEDTKNEERLEVNWLRWPLAIFFLLLAIVIGNIGCQETPVDPDPPKTETVIKTLTAVDSDNEAVTTGVAYYNNDTNQQLENPVEREKGSELDVRAEKDGYNPQVQTVTFDSDGEVVFTLTEDNPDNVTKTIIPTDGENILPDARLYDDDTNNQHDDDTNNQLGTGETELTRKKGTELAVRAEADGYQPKVQTVTFDTDGEVEIALSEDTSEPETVSISITPDIVGYTDRLANTNSFPRAALDNTVYTLTIGDSTWTDSIDMHDNLADYVSSPFIREGSETVIKYPTGSEAVNASLHIVYVPKEGHEYSDNHYLNVAEGTMEIPLDGDSDVTFPAEHIPACSDGVDNTFSGTMDENAPGCQDTWTSTSTEPGTDGFVYEPEDDVELLHGLMETYGIYTEEKDYFVSGKDGEREIELLDSRTIGSHYKIAVSMETNFTKLVEGNQTGEEFAIQIHNGPEGNLHTVSTTEIIPDEGNDGWTEVTVPLSREYFNNGDSYEVHAVHATKVRGEPSTDGDDDVVIWQKERDDYFTIRAIYEPEELPEEGAQKQLNESDIEITDTEVDWR